MTLVSKCHPPRPDKGHGMCNACYQKWYRANNLQKLREDGRNKHFKTKYGITADERDALLESQGNKCALCLDPLLRTGPRTHLDHCHTTNTVRGVLCNRCNWHMEKVDSDPTIIDHIKKYKERYANG